MEHSAPRRSGAQVPALWALGPTRCDVGCFHGRWAQRLTWPPSVFMDFIIWLGMGRMGQKRSKTIVIAWLGNIHKCQAWLLVPFGRVLTHTHMLFINSLHVSLEHEVLGCSLIFFLRSLQLHSKLLIDYIVNLCQSVNLLQSGKYKHPLT